MTIRSMLADHIENPLGYRLESPVLSWIIESGEGDGQSSARVLIGADENLGLLLFDSGEREDISSLGYRPEIDLKPRTRYYWRVEVVSRKGERALSDIAWFETGKRDEIWRADWIAAPFDKDVHPIFERSFDISEMPSKARVYMTGLGVYELTLNGQRVSDEVLAPFCNDYNLWIQTQTYDVTSFLKPGENRVEIMLGNGWYKGRFGFIDKLDKLYGDQMKLLFELVVSMPDGRETTIVSDRDWRCRPSPVIESSIYDGEVYDARLEGAGDWQKAIPAKAPVGKLIDRLSPPVRICRRVPVAQLLHTPADEWVLDFGQVMTGWAQFHCDLPEGAQVKLEYGEILQNDCFYRENLRTAKQEYAYISAGRPALVRPFFTFYGFRYVKVTGMENIDISKFTGCVVHSDLAVSGHIETSNPKVNRLIQNAFWGQIGNFLDIPTDCPQRDERMGWTGDAHVFAPTACFNMYTPAFYDKYLCDMLLEQRELSGAVPHVVPDVLDQIARVTGGVEEAFGSCAWGDAATGIPWTLYQFYGDKDMLRRHYENMRLWVDWIKNRDDEMGYGRLWTSGFHFADWLALDNPVQGSSFGGTDPYYVASAFYCHSARLVARAAEALGLEEDREYYDRLADEVRSAFRREFITETGRVAENTQTAMVMALAMDLIPDEHRDRLCRDLRKKLESRDCHMDTGFVGTYYLCRTLSENGMNDLAYTLLLNEDYPSWLYEVNMGATTIWERWNSVLPNGLVSDTGMNSMNHYAYGSVVEWIYRFVCGLNPASPGFKRARIAPLTDARLEWAKCSYDSACGIYECGWKRTTEGVEYDVLVPFDCEAQFVPENPNASITLNGKPVKLASGELTLEAGRHHITCVC